jgi:hypothetical protein
MIASMVVLAHNATPHHHHETASTFADHHDHHDDDHDDDDHDHSDHFGTHYIANCFTEQSNFPEYKAFHSPEILLPQFFQVVAADAQHAADDHQIAVSESPPLLYLIPSLSYRGPPVC